MTPQNESPRNEHPSPMYMCKNIHQFELHGAQFSYQQPVNIMRFSPNGRYLAVGFDDGVLVILSTKLLAWKCARVYKVGATIRSLVWHPTIPAALVIGSGNGDINKLQFVENDELPLNDFKGLECVTNFVHAIAINADASQTVVAYGRRLVFIDTTAGFKKNWEITASNSIRALFGHGTMREPLTVGDLHFIDNQTILASFVDAGAPFIAYSTAPPYQVKWTMKGREGPDTWMGRSAISPHQNSGIRLLAVTNLHNGIDWYCLYQKRYMMTTRYELGLNVVVDIEFIDDMTVIVGQGSEETIIATFGMEKDPSSYTIRETSPIQIRRVCGSRLVPNDKQLTMAAAVSDDRGNTTIIGLAAICMDEDVSSFALQSRAVRGQALKVAERDTDDMVALVIPEAPSPSTAEAVDRRSRVTITDHATPQTTSEGGRGSPEGAHPGGAAPVEASRTAGVAQNEFQNVAPFLFILFILAIIFTSNLGRQLSPFLI
ncbi:hypothetical protein BD779DRAFT_1676570 [Infundibulicybe gibba]|nr:hypothetical protein BD779DRAFT_1676570 [Infundibulicybe gibba]